MTPLTDTGIQEGGFGGSFGHTKLRYQWDPIVEPRISQHNPASSIPIVNKGSSPHYNSRYITQPSLQHRQEIPLPFPTCLLPGDTKLSGRGERGETHSDRVRPTQCAGRDPLSGQGEAHSETGRDPLSGRGEAHSETGRDPLSEWGETHSVCRVRPTLCTGVVAMVSGRGFQRTFEYCSGHQVG